jgi:integrase
MRARGTGSVYQRPGRTPWWIKYYDGSGTAHRESSGSTVKSDAERLLKKRLGEVASGRRLVGPGLERTTFEDLERLILEDYRLNERKSADSVRQSFRALRERFSGWRARDITYDELTSYAAARGAKAATVRREFALLHRAFILAARAGKAECPAFPTIRVQNARSGFFEQEQWEAVRENLPEHARDVGDFAYLTGWRVMEILTLAWRQVDSGFVRLSGTTTKNGVGRAFPFKGVPSTRNAPHSTPREYGNSATQVRANYPVGLSRQ